MRATVSATVSLICLVTVLCLAQPAQAQLRGTAPNGPSPTQLYDTSRDLLGKIFDDDHFRMSHSYEMSMSSFGGQSASMGMYTNTMRWQFNDSWAARVDVSMMQPFSGQAFGNQQQPRLFLRNAEVAYRPSENTEFRIQIRQSPFGRYASPHGRYSPFGYGSYGMSSLDRSSQPLFWRQN